MAAGEVILNVLFYAFAAAAVGGALAVAAGRNIVRSAFALLAVLLAVASMYAIMKADFLAAAQILIYVGGILVLIIFAVMLTHRISDVRLSNESAPGPAAFFASLCLLFALGVIVISYGKWERGAAWKAARAGEAGLSLAQYQADGSTGLAWGGGTHEDRAVAAVRGARGWERAEVEASGSGPGKPAVASAPVAGDEARVELRGLPEGAVSWRVRLRKGEEASGWAQAPTAGGAHFTVHRGLTKPLARALMGPYLLAFEIVSVLLLAALVGAVTLARKEIRE
jgi:NADH:ubiquinone oxidoreductase subunit 6 (subunit J)